VIEAFRDTDDGLPGVRSTARPFRDARRFQPAALPLLRSRVASGLSALNEDQIAERGARMARRVVREYREYLSAEQRRQPGCPAREVVLDQRGQATKCR